MGTRAGNKPGDTGDGREATLLGTDASEENPGSGSMEGEAHRIPPGGLSAPKVDDKAHKSSWYGARNGVCS